MIWKPHVTVAAIAEQDGRYLMVEEETGGRIVINQPAGHLDEGESLLQAVIRETLEETAWHFVPDAITGVYLWRSDSSASTYLRVCFSGTCRDHEPARSLDSGIVRAIWMSRTDLGDAVQRLRSPMVLRCLDDHLSGRRFPLALLNQLPMG